MPPGRLRLGPGDPVPRLRRHRGQPEAASSASRTSPRSTSPSASARASPPSTGTGSSAWATRRRPRSRRSGCSPSCAGDGAGEVPANPDDPYVRAIRGGKVTAPLVGGCLWLLMQTMGTPWEIDLEGAIFFFEDYDLPPYYAGRDPDPARAGRQTRRRPRSRSRRHGEVRLGRPPARAGRGRVRSRTCSRSTWSRWASPCYTSFPWGTGSTSRPSRSASRRRSTRTRGRSRSSSPAWRLGERESDDEEASRCW